MPYKEPGGTYRGTVRFSQPKIRESKRFLTQREAKKWEKDRTEEITKLLSNPQQGMALLDFSIKYLDEVKANCVAKVYSEKRSLVKRMLKTWEPNILVKDITTEMIYDLIDKRETNNLFNKDRKNIKAMWQFGQDIFGFPINPVAKIKKRGHTAAKQYVPPVDHMLRILAVTTREEQVFLDAYLQTAGRRCEILGWTWADDINFERRQVRLGTRKTKDHSIRYDWMPMTDDLYESLKWLWNHRKEYDKMKRKNIKSDNPYVFPSRTGKPYQERRYFLPELCERAKVTPKFGYHALRRFVASILVDKYKVSMKAVQRILRHGNLATTERYVENMDTDMVATMGLLSKDGMAPQIKLEAENEG